MWQGESYNHLRNPVQTCFKVIWTVNTLAFCTGEGEDIDDVYMVCQEGKRGLVNNA
jgi:hypothetical protein